MLGAALVVAALVPTVRHVLASAPQDATLPDFAASQTVPTVETTPQTWSLEVTTGGVDVDDHVTFSFLYKGHPGDRQHAVNFRYLDPNNAGQAVAIGTLPGAPVPAPSGVSSAPVQTQMCATPNTPDTPKLVTVDPYAQTITLTIHTKQSAGTVMVYCFTSTLLVGFPADAGSDYSVRYTEPGGSTETPTYTVHAQSSAVDSVVTQVLDADGSDRTDAGLGGSQPAVFGTTYALHLVPSAPGVTQYTVATQAFDASSDLPDPSATVVVKGTVSSPGCDANDKGQLCPNITADPTDHTGIGTITVRSTSNRPDYVVIAPDDHGSNQVRGIVSITVGPPNSPPPTPAVPETPFANPGGGTPAPLPKDAECPSQQLAAAHGVGARDVLDAAEKVLIPEADLACPDLSSKLNFVGSNDALGLHKVLGDCYAPYQFTGTDRPMTATEYGQYTGQNACTGGVQQFPVLIEPVVVTYNLPGCNVSQVNLRSTILSAILTGQITSWSDPKLANAADNPGLATCNLPILVAHDVGPATLVFKDYLSKQTALWNSYKQPEFVDAWPSLAPVSCTANGSAAMALCVEGQPGMIGYGYYHDIAGAGLPIAAMEDSSHVTFQATPLDPTSGCEAAADTNPAVPVATNLDWSNASITDNKPLTYPICGFDFVVVPNTCTRSHTGVRAFLGAVYTDVVQNDLVAHGFARIPPSLMAEAQNGYSDTLRNLGANTAAPNANPLGTC